MIKKSKKSASYIDDLLSVTLVLFIFGVLGAILLQTKLLTDSFKEKITLQAELRDDNDDVYKTTSAELKKLPFVHRLDFVSKEDAAKQIQAEMGENFIDILGFNPLFNSFNINIAAQYAVPDSLKKIKQTLEKNSLIKEVTYPNVIAETLYENVNKISLVLIVAALLFLMIVIALIDNTIRLNMYSDRFLIKSMQLVGATKWFIIKPYLIKAIIMGFLGGVMASGLLYACIYFLSERIEGISLAHNMELLLLIFTILIVVGLLLSFISTLRSVTKYLKLKLDELY